MASRQVKVEILGDAKNVQKAFGAAGKAAGGLGSAFGSVAKIAGGFVVGQGLLKLPGLFKSAGEQARQMELDANKIATVFGDSLPIVEQWAQANAHAMGLTRGETQLLAANMADLLKPMGFTADQAAVMSTEMVGLSGALAEWSGGTRTSAEVAEILQKALLGETESLKGLGISLSQADIQARLAAKGQGELTGEALAQAKAIAIQELILEKSTDAQEAYADGADSAARKQAIATAKMKEAKELISTALMPVVAQLTVLFASLATVLAEKVLPFVIGLAEKLAGPISTAFGLAKDGLITFKDALSGDWADAEGIHPLHRALGNIGLIIREQVIPFFEQVADFITKTVIPAVSDLAGSVITFITDTVKPSFESLVDIVLPKLSDLASFVTDTVIPAVTDFAGQVQTFITDTVKPAIESFVDTVLPKLEDFGVWFTDTALPAITDFATQVSEFFTGTLMPAIQSFVDTVLPKLQDLGSWLVETGIPAFQNLAGAIADRIPGALESIGNGFQTVWEAIQPVVNFLKENMDAVFVGLGAILTTVLVPAIALWTIATLANAAAHIAAAAAWALAYLPIVAILAAVGIAAGALYLAWNENLFGIQEITQSVLGWLQENILPIIEEIWAGIQVALDWLQVAWGVLWEGIKWVAENIIPPILEGIQIYFETWWGILQGIFGFLQSAWELLWPAIQWVAENIIPPIIDGVTWYFTSLWESLQVIWGWIQTAWDVLWPAIQWVAENVVPPIIDGIKWLFETLQTKAQEVLDAIQLAWETVWPILKTVYEEILQPLFETIKTVVGEVQTAFEEALDGLQLAWETVWPILKEAFETVWTVAGGLVSIITGVISDTIGAFETALNGLKTTWDTVWGGLQSIVDSVRGGILGAIQPIVDILQRASDLWDKVGGIIDEIPGVNRLAFPTTLPQHLIDAGYGPGGKAGLDRGLPPGYKAGLDRGLPPGGKSGSTRAGPGGEGIGNPNGEQVGYPNAGGSAGVSMPGQPGVSMGSAPVGGLPGLNISGGPRSDSNLPIVGLHAGTTVPTGGNAGPFGDQAVFSSQARANSLATAYANEFGKPFNVNDWIRNHGDDIPPGPARGLYLAAVGLPVGGGGHIVDLRGRADNVSSSMKQTFQRYTRGHAVDGLLERLAPGAIWYPRWIAPKRSTPEGNPHSAFRYNGASYAGRDVRDIVAYLLGGELEEVSGNAPTDEALSAPLPDGDGPYGAKRLGQSGNTGAGNRVGSSGSGGSSRRDLSGANAYINLNNRTQVVLDGDVISESMDSRLVRQLTTARGPI